MVNAIQSIDQMVEQLPELLHEGHRVLSLSQVDELHQRPKGTAKRTFRENREHLQSGVDYFDLGDDNRDVKRPSSRTGPSPSVLFTKSGYMLLVKPFRDPLSWDVQRTLVNVYFAAERIAVKAAEIATQSQPLDALTAAVTQLTSLVTLSLTPREDSIEVLIADRMRQRCNKASDSQREQIRGMIRRFAKERGLDFCNASMTAGIKNGPKAMLQTNLKCIDDAIDFVWHTHGIQGLLSFVLDFGMEAESH